MLRNSSWFFMFYCLRWTSKAYFIRFMLACCLLRFHALYFLHTADVMSGRYIFSIYSAFLKSWQRILRSFTATRRPCVESFNIIPLLRDSYSWKCANIEILFRLWTVMIKMPSTLSFYAVAARQCVCRAAEQKQFSYHLWTIIFIIHSDSGRLTFVKC